ncbi:MAG: hypothetical protein GPOALKHO_000368 [Sodalis sp.]|nr:MAG: hypothetical protein GPOALKHO_000368 [Sodalis sp.]
MGWCVPQYDGRMLLEMLMLEGFQARLSWIPCCENARLSAKRFAKIEATIAGTCLSTSPAKRC